MADWQGELEALLTELRVTLEPETPTSASQYAPLELALGPFVGATELSSPSLDDALADQDEMPGAADEIVAIRSEIEATVARVVALARARRVHSTMRDDVILVLRALTRPQAPTADGEASAPTAAVEEEWQLTSAAAVLRFCRIVQQLTLTLGADSDL